MRIRLKLDRLLELIAASGVSQNHWAMRLGLSRGHFSDLVNGKYPHPSRRTQERFLEKFAVTFDDLFEVEVDADDTAGGSLAPFQAALAQRYIIDDEIGHGGMGTVYLARDVKHGRRVAIKVISPEAVSGIGAAHFLKEIRYTARLEHHNILGLLDSGEAAGCPYYVAPYMRDGSLRDRLKKRARLPLVEAAPLIHGLAKALSHAHQQRIVHCDIKPENILLSEDHPYLADFGISRAVHLETRRWGRQDELDSSAGTPAYVSPEQANGEPDLDGRTDVYSLGCVTYEILAGEPPFCGTTTLEIVAKRFTTVVPALHQVALDVPHAVSSVVARAMAVDKRRRYASAMEFADALSLAAGTGNLFHTVHRWWRNAADHVRAVLPFRAKRPHAPILGGLVHDLRFAFRAFRRAPSFAVVVVLTLALGIGATTSIFSLVNGVLLRPPPYPAADRLVMIQERDDRGRPMWASYLNFADWRSQSNRFEGVAALTWPNRTTVLGGAEPVRAPVAAVSRDFFQVAGVAPVVGRTITPLENQPGASPVTVVSHRFWQQSLGGMSTLDGTTVQVGTEIYDVVGVMPAGFQFLGQVDLWLPLDRSVPWNIRGNHVIRVVGRMRSDVAVDDAQRSIDVVAQRIKLEFPDATEAVGVVITPLRDWIAGPSRRPLLLLFGASALLLLVACSNIASSMLARGVIRRRELTVRTALGAGRWRITRQLLTESLVLAGAGATIGLAASVVVVSRVAAFGPAALPRLNGLSVDAGGLAFAAAACVASVALFGLAPALPATRRAFIAPVGDTRGARARGGVWSVLVTSQITIALILLVGAGLLIRSSWAIAATDTGFIADGVLTANISLPSSAYHAPDDITQFHERLIEDVLAAPGVERTGMVNLLPFATGNWVGPFEFDNGERASGPAAHYRIADAGYFETLGIPLLRGRLFDQRDSPNAAHVVVINESMADRYWPNVDPIGRRIYLGGMDPYHDNWLTVVGIVGEARHWRSKPGTQYDYYVSVRQRPIAARSMTVVVSGSLTSSRLAELVSARARAIDAAVPVEFELLSSTIAESTADRRFTMYVLGSFALAAMALAAAGAYGVLSYSIAQRERELGIRLALGATPSGLVRLAFIEAMRPVAVGLVVGTVSAIVLSRWAQAQLFEVSPTDPITFVVAVIVLATAAGAATFAPARRSATVDPMRTIQSD